MSSKCLFAAMTIVLAVSAAAPAQFFFESFQEGDLTDGRPVKWVPGWPPHDVGTHLVVDGALTLLTADAVNKTSSDSSSGCGLWSCTETDIAVDDILFGDVSIRTRASTWDDGYNAIGLFARSGGKTGSGSVYAYVGTDGKLGIGVSNETLDDNDDPTWTASSNLDPRVSDVHLELNVCGDSATLTAWSDGMPKPSQPQVVAEELPDIVQDPGSVGAWSLNILEQGRTRTAFHYFEAAPVGSESLDCSGDGIIDLQDADCASSERLDTVFSTMGLLRGDADGDGTVDFPDFVILSDHFGAEGVYTQGDFDKDGVVQFSDFVILSDNFGKTSNGAAAVPEPGAFSLLAMGVMLLGRYLRRLATSRFTYGAADGK